MIKEFTPATILWIIVIIGLLWAYTKIALASISKQKDISILSIRNQHELAVMAQTIERMKADYAHKLAMKDKEYDHEKLIADSKKELAVALAKIEVYEKLKLTPNN